MSARRTSPAPRTLRGRVVRMAVVMAAAALALTGCDFSVYSLPLPGGADLGDNPYSVKIEFRDVLDLVPQSAVKVDDVTVGRVDSIKARGYHAEVTVLVKRSVKLPDNAVATIRQTSLLGEKFVSLAPPPVGASTARLGDGDVIPLSASGRNPEVEEVLGALSLLLNGGGVAQLKTISYELNNALHGRESDVKSVLSQLDSFMKQLDTNKLQIVRAIESLNRLAVSLNKEQGTIKLALDDLPKAIASVNAQRDDLVKMLKALADLSSVGTRVIRDSKVATIDSLRSLAPTLTKLAEAGNALPKALQVFLTYPFVDAVVGKNPAQARNLHMGDYTNLSIKLDLDASAGLPSLPSPTEVCKYVPEVGKKLCGDALSSVLKCLGNLQKGNVAGCTSGLLDTVCKNTPKQFPNLCDQPAPTPSALAQCFASGKPNGAACSKVRAQTILYQCTHKKAKYYGSDTCKRFRQLVPTGGGGGLPNLPGGLTGGSTGGGGLLGGLNRPPTGDTATRTGLAGPAPDSTLAAMLTWGMVQR
jgi:phospholipid/cholesterol/gamma-HCH transport system substrate-binding protein